MADRIPARRRGGLRAVPERAGQRKAFEGACHHGAKNQRNLGIGGAHGRPDRHHRRHGHGSRREGRPQPGAEARTSACGAADCLSCAASTGAGTFGERSRWGRPGQQASATGRPSCGGRAERRRIRRGQAQASELTRGIQEARASVPVSALADNGDARFGLTACLRRLPSEPAGSTIGATHRP